MSLMKRTFQVRFQHLARNDGNYGKILCSSEMSRIVIELSYCHVIFLLSHNLCSDGWNVETRDDALRLSRSLRNHFLEQYGFEGIDRPQRIGTPTGSETPEIIEMLCWMCGGCVGCLKETCHDKTRTRETWRYRPRDDPESFWNHFNHFQSIRPDFSCFDFFGLDMSNKNFPSQRDTKDRSWETFTKRKQSFRCFNTPFRCATQAAAFSLCFPNRMWCILCTLPPLGRMGWACTSRGPTLDLRQEMATSKCCRCSWSTAWTKTCYPPKGRHLWTWHV